jgi:hypothetical protein
VRWGTFSSSEHWFPQLIVVLSFSCHYLVSTSPREVGQFSFGCGLWFRRSAVQSTTCPALEVAFHCVCLDFCTGVLFLFPAQFLWGRFSVPSAPSAVHVLWWFTVCFSVLQSSLALGAAPWLRRWALWSTSYPALGSGLLPTCSSCLSCVCLLLVWHWD